MQRGFQPTFSEHIGTDERGHLLIERADAMDLAARFGTPLYVVSEQQIRTNVSRMLGAFRSRYPDSAVFFATKSNWNPTVRRVFSLAGAGGDAFGPGELSVTLDAGTPPEMVVLNGFNKAEPEIRMAIEAGVTIHLDAPDELDLVLDVARTTSPRQGGPIRIGLRSRPTLAELDTYEGDFPREAIGPVWRELSKVGMPADDVVALAHRALREPGLALVGLHTHIGRWAASTYPYEAVIREQVALMARLRAETGWTPRYLDFGGGIVSPRREGHGPGRLDNADAPTYEDYAEALTRTLRVELERHGIRETPTLIVEPGRGLVSNTTVLLSTVGSIKRIAGTPDWVGVDATWNQMLNIPTWNYYYHPVVADRVDSPPAAPVNVVGPLCWWDNLVLHAELPPVARGDIIAFLDTGAYCEAKQLQMDAWPRAATVLVSGDRVELITERETLGGVFERFRVPTHLASGVVDPEVAAGLRREVVPVR